MKTNYSKMVIVALALLVAFSTTTLANDGDKENPTTELKFIGNIKDQPVFELNLNNTDDEYTVTFRDEAGNVLYSDKFKGAAGLTKKFLVKSDGFNDVALNVVVKSKKSNTSAVYTINRNSSYVEETQVNKIK